MKITMGRGIVPKEMKGLSVSAQVVSSSVVVNEATSSANEITKQDIQPGKEACTPVPTMISKKGGDTLTNIKKFQTARKIASLVRNPSSLKPKDHLQSSQDNNVKPSVKRETNAKNTARTPNLAQENQAIKRQKLEAGKARQAIA